MTEAERKWQFFAEFCRFDGAAGGPDPHMKVAAHLVRTASEAEKLWMVGCYMGTYVVPSAEVIFREWPASRVWVDPAGLANWLDGNWDGIVLRRERRAVRTPVKLGRYLRSYSGWILDHRDDEWLRGGTDYDAASKALSECYGVGRYIALKGLELMYLTGLTRARLGDLRARGGWSPRQALAFLQPEHEAFLLGDDSAENCARVEAIAATAKERLRSEYGVDLSWYEFQTFLCDWKQCYAGRRQYPGRSLDSEIGHARKVWAHFGNGNSGLLQARAELFPHTCLGEMNSWQGVREELGNCQAEWGYTWSDTLYDWQASKEALAFPQERAA